ncbi:MAG: MFS transporter [Gammaproteobacteria bacterium]|nr:MFS transporter [Gammaproteobacteria bacterium]
MQQDNRITVQPNSPLVFVMAVASGLSVANLYYAQPLLHTLARGFGVSNGAAGSIITMTQLGYAIGLVLLVPLGDLLERRRLITRIQLGAVVALVAAAVSPKLFLFDIACLFVGITAVVAQVLVPFAAHLARDADRGRVVGRVMSGLLLGILLARVASGLISDVTGWRGVYWIAALLMLIQTIVLARVLPAEPAQSKQAYGALLLSILHLMRDEPVLRRRIVYGMAVFAGFSVLWTSLPFLLAPQPYDYSDSIIGLFGLLGVAGVLMASFAGHLHDRGHSHLGTGGALTLVVISFALMGLWPYHVAAIILGIVLLDLGVQGTQILNQSTIYSLRPEARSRITTAYMTCFFIGGAIGSAVAAAAFSHFGWTGVAIAGGSFGAIGFLSWLTDKHN